MLTDARTHVVVTYTDKTDSVGGIVGKTIEGNLLRKVIAGNKLEGNREILVDKLIHSALNLLLLLTRGLVVEIETHLTLLTLHMGIITPPTAEDTDHRLV